MIRRAGTRGDAVAVTHELEEPDALADALSADGLDVLVWSTVRTAAPEDPTELTEAVATLDSFHWLAFTSRRAVRAVRALRAELPRELRVAAVGERVAAAVTEAGWRVSAVGDHGAGTLGLLLAPRMSADTRVLFPAGALASGSLAGALESSGATVVRVEAYRTVPADLDSGACAEAVMDGRVAAITFLSPSAVDGIMNAFHRAGCADAVRSLPAVCVGETTASRVRALAFSQVRVSARTDKTAVAEAVAHLLNDVARPTGACDAAH
jgi:uroporphyrinogen-III synthase